RSSLCLAFDVMDSDLPFRNAFPLLLRNAVSYLVSEGRAWLDDQYPVGGIIEPRRPIPDHVERILLESPRVGGADRIEIPVIGRSFVCDRTRRPGPLRFTIGDDTASPAINLATSTETRIAPTMPERLPAERLQLSAKLFGTLPWLALAMTASFLIGFEWLAYHFRWTE